MDSKNFSFKKAKALAYFNIPTWGEDSYNSRHLSVPFTLEINMSFTTKDSIDIRKNNHQSPL